MKKCLFCTNAVDSAEHVWSDWILQDLKPVEPIRIQFGKSTSKLVDNPEIRVKCVCESCNNRWMSDLENENKPHIRAMMHGIPTTLQPMQQRSLTRWAIVKAMVIEASAQKHMLKPFYTSEQKNEIASPSAFIPISTFAWVGRLSVGGFHAGNTHSFGDVDGLSPFHSSITTIVVGKLIIQTLSMHMHLKYATGRNRPNTKPGNWNMSLLEVWPVFGEVRWPPPLCFTHDSIAALVDRWKIGTEASKSNRRSKGGNLRRGP